MLFQPLHCELPAGLILRNGLCTYRNGRELEATGLYNDETLTFELVVGGCGKCRALKAPRSIETLEETAWCIPESQLSMTQTVSFAGSMAGMVAFSRITLCCGDASRCANTVFKRGLSGVLPYHGLTMPQGVQS